MNPGDKVKFDEATNTISIEKTEGVLFRVGGETVDGDIKINKKTTVRAYPRGRLFDKDVKTEWVFSPSGSDDEPKKVEGADDSQENEVDDVPPAATAGNTPQAPQQAIGGVNVSSVPGTRTPRP